MKTSNILLLSAVVVLSISLIAYNMELKAEYLTIKKEGVQYYKNNRFNDYHQAKVAKFENLDLLAANCIRVNLEYGATEAVWIRKWDKGFIKVTQVGDIVSIDLSEKGKKEMFENRDFEVVIIMPRINKIKTKAVAIVKKEKNSVTSTISMFSGRNNISGFNQDSIEIDIAGHVGVQLDKNQFKYLNASVGNETGDGVFSISSDNYIQSLKLNVLAKSMVEILDTDIQKIDHKLSEDAVVTLNGKAISLLK